jgi:hypothetical protein
VCATRSITHSLTHTAVSHFLQLSQGRKRLENRRRLGTMAHTVIPAPWQVEIGRIKVQGQLGQKLNQ